MRVRPPADAQPVGSDGSRPGGRIVEYDARRDALLFRPVAPPGLVRTLPASESLCLDRREPGKPSSAGAVLGLLVGELVGATIGGVTAPDRDEDVHMETEPFEHALEFGAIGAVAGMVAGLVFSGSSGHHYVIDCLENREFLPLREPAP